MKPANGKLKIEDFYWLPPAVAKNLRFGGRYYSDFEDACQEGLIGLFKAFRDRRKSYSRAEFKTYAIMKVRGAILDYIREIDPLSRTDAKKLNAHCEGNEELLGKTEEMNNFRHPQSLDAHCEGNEELFLVHEAVPDSNALMPSDAVDRGYLHEQINLLPKMQRKVIALYYFEGLRLNEIGEVFGLTGSRICQIRSQGILSLRRLFGEKVIQDKNIVHRKKKGFVKNIKLSIAKL